ncbi:MAG TPA: polysaccharide biosynthesis tyrosine autokinase [Phnomibacter sp.]|nr:polysaccharide biosynthesis tyrosine autokinase [Phnomibacter sp.]
MTPFPSEYNPTGDESGGKFSPADILFKYLAFLPLFLVSLALCVAGGMLYLRYTTPKYTSTVQLLIKSGESNPVYGDQGGIVERALYGPRDINMSNEIQKLRTIEVFRRTVIKHKFHIQYFNEGNIKTSNLFDQVPYLLVPVHIADSNASYKVRFTNLSAGGYTLLVGLEGKEEHAWKDILNINGSQFSLQPKDSAALSPTPDKAINITTWTNPQSRATEILNQVGIYQGDPNTTILNLRITNDNPYLARAILDALVKEYILYSVETKNVASEATIVFIHDRIDSLSLELARIENQLKTFNDRNDLIPVEQQTGIFTGKLSDIEEKLTTLDWQADMLSMLENYIKSPRRKTELVPSPLGIEDPTIAALVGNFNSLRLERDKTARQTQPGSLQLQELDKQLEENQRSIFEAIKNYRGVLQKRRNELVSQNGRYFNYLAELPEKKRRQLEIERQQKVKEGLYLYLLQRKEEIAITTASTTPGYEFLNPAGGSLNPVEPDEGKIRMFSILLGLLLPIGIIYLRDLLNDKLMTRDDIRKATGVSIIGEIGHVDNNKTLVVADKSRNIISEQFRIVRSNLAFMMEKRPVKTILVTSTVSGEGKSFISINIAAVLALGGKRVALLEFDLRRPRIMKNLELKKTGIGISNVLMGLANPADVYTPLPGYPELHIYPTGIVPPNPGELVMNQNTKDFFDFLKANYDYIVIDSAPVGLVSDTFSLAPYVDTSIFIVRHRFTYKRQLSFVEEIYRQGKLPYLWMVVNDLKMGARFGYYGYGYGYGKGYGYGYGHYYGYGGGYFSTGADEYYDVKVPAWRRRWKKLKQVLLFWKQ